MLAKQVRLGMLFVITAIGVLLAANAASAQTAVTPPGAGTEASPYLISELGHLVWMADTAASSSGQYYTLTCDLDASATATWNDAGTDTSVLEGFKPIGTYSNPDTTSFRGFFDGGGHTITGLVINRTVSRVGLFGFVGSAGQVRNLGLLDGMVSGQGYVGGLAGWNAGTVSNVYAANEVTGDEYVGGLIGLNTGTVLDAYATGTVTGTDGHYYIGGLIGLNASTVSNSYATGAVTGTSKVGGLIGRNNYGMVTYAYATGVVTATGTIYVSAGGLVGENYGTVSNAYWDMQTSGQDTSDGGTGKTTAEMKQQATFAGWDFSTIWGIAEGLCYPYLQFSPPPFRLNVSVVGLGYVSVSPEPVNGGYAPDTLVTLTATSDNEFIFGKWQGAAPNAPLTATILMDGHKEVFAEFWPVITIDSVAALAKIGNDPAYPLADICYHLTTDIDASETAAWNDDGTDTSRLEGFKPIGTYSNPDNTSFRGIFDGRGHSITGLVINRSTTYYVGLFGRIGSGGTVRNLGLVDSAVAGYSYVGGLVGDNYSGTVSESYAAGTVTGYDCVGGLIGENDAGTVSNAYATGAVTGFRWIGGLVGENDSGRVSNAYATGAVRGMSYVGGLIGCRYSGTVTSSYWDTQTSGRTTGVGSGDSTGVTGKTTAEMQTQATFTAAPTLWDFLGESANGSADTWRMCVDGVSYPKLTWQTVQGGDFACGDGVDLDDFARLSRDWQTIYTAPLTGADADGDGGVDLEDLLILAEQWLVGVE